MDLPPASRSGTGPLAVIRGLSRRKLGLGLVVLAIWAALLASISPDDLFAAYLRVSTLVERHFGLALVLHALTYIGIVLMTLPVTVGLTVLGGAVFGPAIGFSLTVVSATIGAGLVFAAARGALHDVFLRRAGRWISGLRAEFHSDAASYLLLLRLAPVFPFVIVNLIAALLGARFRTFLLTTFFGIMPGTMAFTLIGAGLEDVLRREAARVSACTAAGGIPCPANLSLNGLMTPDVLLGLAALAGLVLISIVARRMLRRQSAIGARITGDRV